MAWHIAFIRYTLFIGLCSAGVALSQSPAPTAPLGARPPAIAGEVPAASAASGVSSRPLSETRTVTENARRIRELEAIVADARIDKEKRTAAADELEVLRRRAAQETTAADKARLEEIRARLASPDSQTRAAAKAELRSLLERYGTPAASARKRTGTPTQSNVPRANFPSNPAGAATLPSPGVALPRVTTCDSGGCWDSNGQRYNGGPALMLGPDGRQCQRADAFIQCN